MSGLSGVGRGIGAALGGYNQAIDRQRRMGLEDADASWQQQTRQRQQQQWALQDKDMQDMQAAQAAGAAITQGEQSAFEAAQARQRPGPTLDGGAVPYTPQPYQMSPETRLKAMEASAHELLKRGRYDKGEALYGEAEKIRHGMSAKAAQQLWQDLSAGKDITDSLTAFDRTADDGLEMVGRVSATKDANGRTVYTSRHKNKFTGEEVPPNTFTQEQLQQGILIRIGKPDEFAKSSYATLLENLRSANNVKEKEAETVEHGKRKAADVEGAIKVEDVRTAGNLREIGARGAQDRTTKKTQGAASTAEKTEMVRLLREQRLGATSDVTNLTTELKDARSADKPRLQKELAEARTRMRDTEEQIRELTTSKGGLSDAAPAKAAPMPTSKEALKSGTIYQTSRGPARWNGSAFEAQ